MIPDPADPGLIHELPPFRRAREYRLYDGSGGRYLDLWQLGGHAILGHRPPGVLRLVKNAIERGLVGDVPSVRSGGLPRALRSLLPDYPHTRVYATLQTCLEALSAWTGLRLTVRDLGDPATGEIPSGRVGLWRPFAEAAPAPEVVVPVLPFSVLGGPWAVCLKDDPGPALPAPPPVSPVALEAAAAAVWALRRHDPGELPDTLAPRHAKRYEAVYRLFLSRGVVLSPHPVCPSILPARTSPGERAVLVALLRGAALE
jgi:hypothetical protein